MSNHFFGTEKGMCGFTSPQAMKNGWSLGS